MAVVDADQLAAAVAVYMSVPQPCVLCGRPATVGAAFIPDRPWEFGGSPPAAEKVRVTLYALCTRCFAAEDPAERVEAVLRVGGSRG